MEYTKKGVVADLLDFYTPNVGYEDEEKRGVCGCCGTYYVVGVGELSELKEIVTGLYEAMKAVARDLEGGKGVIFPYTETMVKQALAKAEEK